MLLGRGQGIPLSGKKRYYAYLRLPEIHPHRIWTVMGTEDPVPWGFRTATEVVVSVDEEKVGYTLTLDPDDVKWINVITERKAEDDGGES